MNKYIPEEQITIADIFEDQLPPVVVEFLGTIEPQYRDTFKYAEHIYSPYSIVEDPDWEKDNGDPVNEHVESFFQSLSKEMDEGGFNYFRVRRF